MEISVIIPAWNEAPAIGGVLNAIRQFMGAHAHRAEFIVVDDGSTDGTGEAARNAGALVIRNPSNAGYGFSLRRGIRAASFDNILILDADGTYPIEDIPALIKKYDEGFDMVVGARQGKHYRENLLKHPARILFRWLSEFVAGRSIPDINSGFRLMRKQAVMPYLTEICLGFSFTTSLTLAMMLSGNFVAWVPVSYHARIGASKVKLVRDTLRAAQVLSKTIIRYNPLKLFLLLSFFPLTLSVLAFAMKSVVVAAIFFCTSLVILAIGFFSEVFMKDRAM